MSRLDDRMAALAAAHKKALVAYLCVGDPSASESVDLALACVDAGADVLELGVPFSDPTADGPVIARASERALAAGGGLGPALEAARAIRARLAARGDEVPLVLFGYYNPVFVFGEERLAGAARDAGVDALLVVDLPVEEAASLRAVCKRHDLSVVPLLAPTSGADRVELTRAAINDCSPGFVYYVSLTGVTGSAEANLSAAGQRARELKAALRAPVVVGFGVDSPDKARAATAAGADGVVVGSAIVRLIEQSPPRRKTDVVDLVRALRSGIDG